MAKAKFQDAYQTRVATALTASATSLVVDSITGDPIAPYPAIIDAGTTKEEVVLVTAVTDATKTLTIVRGRCGTTAVAHNVGAIVEHLRDTQIVPVKLIDISTAEVVSIFLPRCLLVDVKTCLAGTIATADAVITLDKNGTDLTNGAVTIAYSGSAEGDVDTCALGDGDEFDGVDDFLSLTLGGASTNTEPVIVNLEILRW